MCEFGVVGEEEDEVFAEAEATLEGEGVDLVA